jgi:hypothetical protein
LAEKEQVLAASDHPDAARIVALSEELADVRAAVKELREAVAAGTRLHYEIEELVSALSGARNWGTLDMLGGGYLATRAKRTRMDQARELVHHCQELGAQFQRELADIVDRVALEVSLDPMEGFADYFFDGLIVDWVVQARIVRSLDHARNAARWLEDLLDGLQEQLGAAEKRANAVEQEWRPLVEGA